MCVRVRVCVRACVCRGGREKEQNGERCGVCVREIEIQQKNKTVVRGQRTHAREKNKTQMRAFLPNPTLLGCPLAAVCMSKPCQNGKG